MDAAGRGVDLLLQRIGIGLFQLRKLAPFEDFARDRHAVAFEAFELVLVGRPVARLALAPALETELVEQYLPELLGAADRERLAREAVDFAFDAQHLVRELARKRSEEHTSELQSLMRTSYAVFCLKKKKKKKT